MGELQISLGVKVERKLSNFFAEKRKWNGNMKTKTEFAERKRNFLCGSGSGNGTTFFGGTAGKRNFCFRLKWNFRFMDVLRSIYNLIKMNCLSNSSPTPHYI
jgi:hypothetical protein